MRADGPILVIDDDPYILQLARLVLRDAGYEVVTAANAYEARLQLHRRRWSLVLMDLQLPGMSGIELTREIRRDRLRGDVPIVAFTACAMRDDEEEAVEAGCDAYVVKPAPIRALLDVVAAHVRSADGPSRSEPYRARRSSAARAGAGPRMTAGEPSPSCQRDR